MLVLDQTSRKRIHTVFQRLADYLNPGDLLVINRSRVVPARLFGRKLKGGGEVEVLLLERQDSLHWKVLVGGKGLKPGRQIQFPNDVIATVEQDLGGAQRLVAFNHPVEERLHEFGNVPLPPYIHKPLADPERYQTVYAQDPGSAAAPTAGLHFTPQLIQAVKAKGVLFAEVVLHIGLDTFAPVTEEVADEHHIHTEWCQLTEETAGQINTTRNRGGRVIAVGTTSVRVLESAARNMNGNQVLPFEGRTDLYILPGYKFKVVDALITNFHLPRSTLIMLVSALAGRQLILETYREAIQKKYRFYSFGDAMLIK